MRNVILAKPVVIALGQVGLSRAATVRLLTRLRHQLTYHYDRYRPRRDPADPSLFIYSAALHDGAAWHALTFTVDDSTTSAHLFVVAMQHHRSGS